MHANDVEQETYEKVIPLKKGGASVKKHKAQLSALSDKDPEFFKFLQENDASLLEFGQGEEDDDEDDLDEDEEEDDEEDLDGALVDDDGDLEGVEFGGDDDDDDDDDDGEGQSKGKERPNIEVTLALVKAVSDKAAGGSLSALKKYVLINNDVQSLLVCTTNRTSTHLPPPLPLPSSPLPPCFRLLSMFRAACIPSSGDEGRGGDSDSDNEYAAEEEEDRPTSRYIIPSPDLFQAVMETTLSRGAEAFWAVLGLAGKKKSSQRREAASSLGSHPRWKKLQLLVLSFFKSVMHVLAGLTKSMSSGKADLQFPVYVLSSLEPFMGLLEPMPRLTRALLKVLLVVWSDGPDPASDALSVRAHAFLRIRQMAMLLQGPAMEECLRSTYLAFARTTKTFTELNAPSVLFMTKCVVELFSIDSAQAYQQAFLYIRQLALHLRSAALQKSADSVRQVTSWQFLNCVRLWTRVICSQPGTDKLHALAYPLAQTCLGVIAIAQSVYLLPLRFHLLQCLQLLAAYCELFIPTASKLIEVLEMPDLLNKPTPSTDTAPKLQFLTKLPTDSAQRAVVRDVLVSEALAMLRHDAEVYRFHVGFPEYVFLTCRKLRAFAKRAKVSKWRDVCRTLISLLDSYSSAAKRGRERLGKAPMLITEFEALRGAAEPVAAARLSKLLAGRGFAPAGDVTVSLAPKAKAGSVSVSGLGAMKAKVPSAEDEEEEEDEDEDEEEEEDEDDEDEDEDEDEDQEDEDDDDDGEDRVEEIGRDFLGDSDED